MGQVLCLWTCTQSVILALGELQSSPSFFRFGASAGLGRKSWSHLGSAAQGLRAEAGGVRGAFWDLKPGGLVGVIRFCTKLGPTHPAGKRGTSLPVWPEEKGLPGGITWDLGHQLSLLPREGRDSSRVDPRLPFTPPPPCYIPLSCFWYSLLHGVEDLSGSVGTPRRPSDRQARLSSVPLNSASLLESPPRFPTGGSTPGSVGPRG